MRGAVFLLVAGYASAAFAAPPEPPPALPPIMSRETTLRFSGEHALLSGAYIGVVQDRAARRLACAGANVAGLCRPRAADLKREYEAARESFALRLRARLNAAPGAPGSER